MKFELSNQSSATISNVLFAVSILKDDRVTGGRTPMRLLAGPFAVRVKATLDPGHTAEYEMLLRHLAPTCECVARVRVLSFRSSGDTGPPQASAVRSIEKP